MRMKRLVGFFGAGVVLAGGILFYLHFFLSAPVGSGPAGPAVSKETFLKPWTQRDVLLVGIGDSVTAGFGARKGQPWVLGYSNRLESMIQQIQSNFPGGVEIYLANIFDPTDEKGDIQRAGLPPWKDGLSLLASYNQIISDAVARHRNVHLVDIHSAFLGHGIHCSQFWSAHYDRNDPHYWYYSNLEDPNERGYDAMRRLFLIEMAKTSDRIK